MALPESASRLRTAVLLGLCCLLIYNANRRGISAGDTYPARYIPFAIVEYHTVFMNPVAKVAAQGRGDGAFWMLPMPSGRVMSLYPVVVPLLVSPLYVPAVAYLRWRGWSDAALDYVAKLMEKLSASLIAALSVSLLYLLLRRRTTQGNALLLTIAYAFGTTTWMISSQALWQHGVAELLIIFALLLLTGECTTPRALMAGFVCGLIACNRPPDVLLGAALGLYALWWAGRRRAVALIVSAALPMLVVLFYNVHFGGNIAGGYGVIGRARFFSHPLLPGIAGLLVSATHGLFIFSPFLLFLVLLRFRRERALSLLMIGSVVVQICLYAKADWRAGLSWGPRYMTDFLPFLIWMLVPVVENLRTIGRAVFATAVGVSIVLEAIGAFTYTPGNDLPIFAIKQGPHQMDGAWKWDNAPFLTSPKHGLAAPDLAVRTMGTFDAIETDGNEVVAAGWALAGHRTPAQVAVSVDGHEAFATSKFLDRPDVRATLGETSPSGWRIAIDAKRLTPGEHHFTAMVWPFPNGEGQYLGEKTLTIAGDFATAAARLREHQQAEGFWLTSFTSGTRFVDPRPEMNTFLTALLVDLLEPVAGEAGLDQSLDRARRHLTAQIEADGLVRYHGLPNAPWIGRLGCVITPDTDDTALVWRIAPRSDRRPLANALATIDRYRTPDGLYRSWLAPRDAYQCLDPGRDPNPTDIAIQMHLVLLLAKERPPAAHDLCDALRRFIDDDRIWVYYRRTPLVPMLRAGDLRNAGCELALPESRMRTDIDGQRIWLSVVRMITSDSPDPVLARATLDELARDDFKLVQTNPPLLYHNDLTATVSRYYWSEDAGYALWLRLYRSYEHHRR